MKRKINPFWVLYSYIICFPLSIVYTAFTSIVTIVMIALGMRAERLNSFVKLWAKVLCFLALSAVRVEGRNNIDPQKSYIFISNHQGNYDIFSIYGYLPNRFAWIMKEELRKVPLVGKACASLGHVFINRSSKMKSMQSLQKAEQILKGNNTSVVLFPEGTRTSTGKVGMFKRGAFFMARDLHMPIVPMSLNGSFKVMPKGCWWIVPHSIVLTFHKPIDTEELTQDNMQEYIDRIHEMIRNDVEE